VVVPAEIRRALAEHARAEAPNEACGLIAFRGEVAERYIPATNAAESPYRFELEPRDTLDFFLEDEGYELAVFHSHLSGSARPPRTDVENVGLWQGRPYLIPSLGRDELRAWRIRDGQVAEEELSA
jgi:[CysO sulfur-carrier protein]-S-L-cysteine hydrolase